MAENTTTSNRHLRFVIRLIVIGTLASLAMSIPAPGVMRPVPGALDDKDILDRMILNPSLKTFVNLIAKADMIEMVKGEGPFTMFAPNDDAFSKVPRKLITTLQKDKPLLKKFLTYQMFAGRLESKDFKEGPLKSIEGESFNLSLKKGLKLNEAKFVSIDDRAANGVVHIIDTVVFPPSIGKKLNQLTSAQPNPSS